MKTPESAAVDMSATPAKQKRGASATKPAVKAEAAGVPPPHPARKRMQRPFPASSFEEAMQFARELFVVGSGQPVRRLTLFDHLKKSPDSGASRMLITNSNRYGLTRGSYVAEQLELTEEGSKAVDDQLPKREQRRVWAKLAILDIDPFKVLYEKFVNSRLPARAVLTDAAKEAGVPSDAAEECVDTFIVNLRFVELLQTLAGADRIVTLDHMLDVLPASSTVVSGGPTPAMHEKRELVTQEHAEFETTCFYITPIGEEDSDQRKHSDLFLSNIVEPALQPFGLKVIRADAIDKPRHDYAAGDRIYLKIPPLRVGASPRDASTNRSNNTDRRSTSIRRSSNADYHDRQPRHLHFGTKDRDLPLGDRQSSSPGISCRS